MYIRVGIKAGTGGDFFPGFLWGLGKILGG